MMSSTSITSTIGVTLISDATPLSFLPIAMSMLPYLLAALAVLRLMK
jgi:hypothetical protein